MTLARLAFALSLLAAPAAMAQPRDFNCVGAEGLEYDTATLRFARNADRLPEGAAATLRPLAEAARADNDRNICVLGYAAAAEGGAQTASRLAARRARAVAAEMARLGVERDRIRAETRTRGFTRGSGDRQAEARIILMPTMDRPIRGMPMPGIAINFVP